MQVWYGLTKLANIRAQKRVEAEMKSIVVTIMLHRCTWRARGITVILDAYFCQEALASANISKSTTKSIANLRHPGLLYASDTRIRSCKKQNRRTSLSTDSRLTFRFAIRASSRILGPKPTSKGAGSHTAPRLLLLLCGSVRESAPKYPPVQSNSVQGYSINIAALAPVSSSFEELRMISECVLCRKRLMMMIPHISVVSGVCRFDRSLRMFMCFVL